MQPVQPSPTGMPPLDPPVASPTCLLSLPARALRTSLARSSSTRSSSTRGPESHRGFRRGTLEPLVPTQPALAVAANRERFAPPLLACNLRQGLRSLLARCRGRFSRARIRYRPPSLLPPPLAPLSACFRRPPALPFCSSVTTRRHVDRHAERHVTRQKRHADITIWAQSRYSASRGPARGELGDSDDLRCRFRLWSASSGTADAKSPTSIVHRRRDALSGFLRPR
jgi:hypothetical protein